MNIQEFELEYDNLTVARKKDFLRRLFNTIIENLEDNDSLNFMVTQELIPALVEYEADDGFGTEGFRG